MAYHGLPELAWSYLAYHDLNGPILTYPDKLSYLGQNCFLGLIWTNRT